MRAGLRVPDFFVPEIRRGCEHRRLRLRWRFGVAHLQLHLVGDVLDRIEHRHLVRAVLGRSKNEAIGVHCGIAFVARGRVVQVGLGIRPVPHRDDGVALDALRALRLRRRQLARGNPVGPFTEHPQTRLSAHPFHVVDHLGRRLAGLDAARPCLVPRFELTEPLGNGAGRRVAQLMAADTAIGLDDIEVLTLVFDVRVDAVAGRAGAGEVALPRDLDHRIPIDRRIVLGRSQITGRLHGREIKDLAGLAVDLW